MADVRLSQQDIDYIARVVETEVPRSVARKNPEEYKRMVQGVVDTVTNRMASGSFPATAEGVLNQRRQFSKITGPKYLDPYGSVAKTPRASKSTKNMVSDHIASRAAGAEPSIGGNLHYANPNFSSKSNLTSWINPMIESGAQLLGVGQNVHVHGTAPGMKKTGAYRLSAEGMPGSYVPTPTDRDALPQAQQATGIMSAINPITPSLVERQALPATSNGLLSMASAQMSQPMKGARAAASFSQPQVSLDTLRQQEPAQQGLLGAASAMRPTGAAASGVANFGQPDAAGLLSADVAYQRMIDGLNAQKKQLAAGVNPMADLPEYQQPVQQPVQQPQQIQPSYEQTASVAGPAGVGGLLSAQEQQMLDAQRASLSQQPFNRNLGPRMGNFAKGALGGVGGGILGSLVGGPIGGLLGSLVGKSLMNGKLNTQITGYPQAPKSKSQGDGKETDYGRSVRESSRQYDKAVKSGSVGLY